MGVAAAGNGSGGTAAGADAHGRQKPRYPARFNTVVAVAATNGDGNAARYADRGEDEGTARNGVATFGGDATYSGGQPAISSRPDPKRSSAVRDAPIGLMISDFVPEGTGDQNETGWAYWAGSSFATPIISGLVACLLSGKKGSAEKPPTDTIIAKVVELAEEPGPHQELGVYGIPARQLKPRQTTPPVASQTL